MKKYIGATAAAALLAMGFFTADKASAGEGVSFTPPSGTVLPPSGYAERWYPVSYFTNPLIFLPGAVKDHTNNYACKSAAHPNPVLFLHGGFADSDEDINFLQNSLAADGYCTFSLTYGALTITLLGISYDIGDARSIVDIGTPADKNYIPGSGTQIAAFITSILAETGASKVDIVGHSTGAFMSLYVPKFGYETTVTNAAHGLIDYVNLGNQQVTIDRTKPISARIDRVVSIAPPTRGLGAGVLDTLANAVLPPGVTLSQIESALGTNYIGNLAVGSAAVDALNNGPIAQPGVNYTIIVSSHDEIVWNFSAPSDLSPGLSIQANDSFLPSAANVSNKTVQDYCSIDITGHIGEAYDLNIWALVKNALDPAHAVRLVDPLRPSTWIAPNAQYCVGPNVPF